MKTEIFRRIICTVGPAVAAGMMFAVYLKLLPSGHWSDEFYDFYLLRIKGASYWPDRILYWSPRPIAEFAMLIYGLSVEAGDRPLIVPALGLLWVVLAAAFVLPAFRMKRTLEMRLLDIGFGLSFFVLFLTGGPVTEMYFWPAGAAAYMPTLGGCVALLSLGAAPMARTLALSVAAGTSEIGAMFALIYCVCCFAPVVARAACGDYGMFLRRKHGWPLFVPFTLAISVLVLVGCNRMRAHELDLVLAPAKGHLGTSLVAALTQQAAEAFGTTLTTALLSICLYIIIVLAFAVCPPLLRSAAKPWAVASAALGASLASLTAAYFHFGVVCCERHATLRRGLLLIACSALGAAVRPRIARLLVRVWGRLPDVRSAGTVLCLTALITFLPALPRLRHDLALQPQVKAARSETWVSGRGPGPAMVFHLPPAGEIIAGPGFVPGSYARGGPPSAADWPLLFFGKDRVTIVPP